MTLKGKLANFLAPTEPTALTHSDLLNKQAGAQAAYDEAQRLYQSHTLGAERGSPGAIAAVAEAREAMEVAKQRLRDIQSALIEWEAEQAEGARQARIADHERRGRDLAKALSGRQSAANALVTHLQKAAEAFKRLEAASDDAARALIKGRAGLGLTAAERERLLLQQYTRAGLIGGPSSQRLQFDPTHPIPLDAEISRANDVALRVHEERKPT